jgi:hypothetical protein
MINMSKIKIVSLIIFFCFISQLFSQAEKINFGGGIGFGSLMGSFPSQTTLGTKLFFEVPISIKPIDKIQIHYSFAQKLEKFLPGNQRIDYFSYMHSIGFSGIFVQPLNENINVEEGIGFIYLNDRSFNDINIWNLGLLFNFAGVLPISQNSELTLNFDYGLTFTNTNVSYALFTVLYKYLL